MEKIEFWQNREEKLVNPHLLSSVAEEFAKTIARDSDQSGKKMNKRTQLRKFFDEIIRLKTEADDLNEQDKKWNAVYSLVNMLVAKAAYARGRDLVSDNFLNFMRTAISEIENPEDLKLFSNFFEAFMGFYRLYGPSK